MDITNEQILIALNSLEVKGGLNQLPESLRQAIIAAMSPKKPVKRSPGGRKLTDDEVSQEEFKAKVKGRSPE